jgi:aspartate/methionine/tyrosine aminotransferase
LSEGRCARRVADIAPFYVMDVLGRAKALEAQGKTIVHLEVGEPDFATPAPIIAGAKQALDRGLTHYTSATGIPELRAAISNYYRVHYSVEVDPNRIIVTPGASGALQLCVGILVGPGDAVLISDPGYPCNRHFVRLFEGRPISVPVGVEADYQLTPEVVLQHARSHLTAVMVGTPSNPTGTTVPPPTLSRIIEEARAQGAWPIIDEIYNGLVYGMQSATALALSDEVFVVNSFSKYFGMTGWRLGWLVAPIGFVPALERLAQNLFLAPSTIAQYAALAAFQLDTLAVLEARRQEYQLRRDFLLPALRTLGFEIPVRPSGAFYLYAKCNQFTRDSHAFALELLERAGVAVTPGCDFGAFEAQHHLRFAYTTDLEALQEGVARLQAYLTASA